MAESELNLDILRVKENKTGAKNLEKSKSVDIFVRERKTGRPILNRRKPASNRKNGDKERENEVIKGRKTIDKLADTVVEYDATLPELSGIYQFATHTNGRKKSCSFLEGYKPKLI